QAMQLTLPGGGALQGRLAWNAASAIDVEADWAVAALDLALLDSRLRPSRLQGRVRLQGDAVQQLATLNLNDGRMSAEAQATRHGDAIRLQRLRLARGQAEVRGAGELALSGARAFRFSGDVRHFDLAAWMQSPSSDLNASLELSGQLQAQPHGAARLMLAESRFAGQPLSGQATLDLSAGQRWRGAVELMLGGNRLHAQGEYGKHGDSAAHADDSLRVTLDAPALSRLGLGWGGALTAHLNWRGPLMSLKPQAIVQTVLPSQIQAEFDVNGRELRLAGGHRVASLHSHGQLQAGALRGALHADDWRQEHAGESRRWAQRLEASLSGTPMQHALQAEWQLDTRQALTTRIEGGVVRFAGTASAWQGRIASAVLTGPWALRLLAPWPLAVDGARVSLGAATLQLAEGQVEHIASLWTPTSWQTQGRFGGLRVASGLDVATVLPSTLRLGGDWRLAQSAPGQAPQGTINLQREQGDWLLAAEPPRALGLQQLQLAANLTQGQLRIEAQARGERLGEWRAELSAPLNGVAGEWVARDAPIVGRLNGQLRDMSWIGPSVDGNIQSGGRVSVDLGIDGSRAAPVLSGAVQGEDLALTLLDQGVRLRQGQLRARFEGERLTIDRLDFIAPPSPPPKDRLISRIAAASEAGFVKASGRVDFGARRAQLTLNAQGLPVTPGKDRWLLATAQLQLDLRRELLKISGKIGADAAFFGQPAASRPHLAEDVRLIATTDNARSPTAMNLDLDLEVDVGERCYVRAGGLEARLVGRVKLRGEALRSLSGLRATGAISAREAGFEAYGQRLNVERAIVNFQGPVDDPGLNVVARRSGLPVEAGIEVSGTARAPRGRL
ncbi:MAG TPA: translocation/assembly module TamB domain-containing protein, partial [Rhodocyclaceae bacterium]|nr:translocation/assembly module TamB domain-containing protein [Rhodocyclaceae bacterium]